MAFTLVVGALVIASAAALAIMPVNLREMLRVTLFGSKNNGSTSFEPSRDIPSLAGKVVLVTGAAGDLGRQTALELARWGRPAKIYIADLSRDEDSTGDLLNGLRLEVEQTRPHLPRAPARASLSTAHHGGSPPGPDPHGHGH